MSWSSDEALRALEDLARPGVGVAHLGLLRVGEGEDVQDEQLVDLPAVEEVARALGGDARVVLEDDRRGQERCGGPRARRPGRASSPRCGTPAAALAAAAGGSVSETKAPPGDAQDGVGGAERAPQRVLARSAGPRRVVADDHRHPARDPRRAAPRGARCCPRAAPRSARSRRRAARVVEVLLLAPRRDRDRDVMARGEGVEAEGRGGDLALDGLVPRQVPAAARLELVDPLEARRARTADVAPHDVQEPHGHLDRRLGALHQALGAHDARGRRDAPRRGRRGWTPPNVQRRWFLVAERR